jgi:hypothetical protein
VEIALTVIAGLLSALVLAVVYLADRWEREPIEHIQSTFLTGLFLQLILLVGVEVVSGDVVWSGPWLLLTIVGTGLAVPFHLAGRAEVDERFDGIVYTVAFVAGAVCAIQCHNLPRIAEASPLRDAVAPGAAPDLRDLLIVAGSPGFAGEMGRGLVLVAAAVLLGAVLGVLQMRGWPAPRVAAACGVVGLGVVGIELVSGGAWLGRAAVLVAAIAVAAAVKRRSVFRHRPEAPEDEVLVMALKTVLVVLGAALLATVMLRAVGEGSTHVVETPGSAVAGSGQ